jgi:MFS family permease
VEFGPAWCMGRAMFGLTRYQWLVLFAAWLGWGFDVFDGLLFNFVAPICIPYLLGLDPSDPETGKTTMYWTASLTSLLLLGWAIGGVVFGRITDRLGRTRTLLLTMLTYALGTAACAFAPHIAVLALFRFIAALGIGGEWAAGAALVAETLPKSKRVLGGALLYTSAPFGLFLATFVNDLFTRKLGQLASDPSLSWRAVFLTGLIPAVVALVLRMKIREPEAWKSGETSSLSELFSPGLRERTYGGLILAVTALVTWWSASAFLPVVASHLAQEFGGTARELALRKSEFITYSTTWFNLGGLTGTLLTIPAALYFGRRPMFFIYFLAGAITMWVTFSFPFEPYARMRMMGLLGVSVFGVFGAFSFYLPELFPMRLRGTGAGFCYNFGRVLTAMFPFLVGVIVRSGVNPLDVLRFVALAPVIGLIFMAFGFGPETKHLADAE